MTLLSLAIAVVGLDIQDEMGRHEVGHIDNSMKIPLNNGVGCRFEGQFSINKVRRPRSPSPLSPSSPDPDGHAVRPLASPSQPLAGSGQYPGVWSFLLRAPWGSEPLLAGSGSVGWETAALAALSPAFESQLHPLLAKQRPPSPSAHLSLGFHIFRGRME